MGMIFPFKPDRVFLWSPSPERCTCPEAVAFWEQKDREAEEQNGWITRLALEPSFTGQNLGVQLIGQAVSVYRPLGRSYLRLCIAKEQKEILGFFRAYGFYKIDECAQGDIWEKYIGYHR